MSEIEEHVAWRLGNVEIIDTFAEAFPIQGTRLIVTADSLEWARIAGTVSTGYASSVIGCDVEAAIERELEESETPDGRPGLSILMFAFNRASLSKAVTNRVGQCILTCPTTACYNGLTDVPKEHLISIGGQLRYFGDTHQISKKIGGRRLWRIPVMDGEFLCEDKFGTIKGVAGGNLLILSQGKSEGLRAAEEAVRAMRTVPSCGLPFPGGIVRAGSKVGSQYKKLKASTNDAYSPALRTVTKTALPEGVDVVYEIVVDGLSFDAVRDSMKAGIQAAARMPGVIRITAGNYGGKLGPHHIHLRELS